MSPNQCITTRIRQHLEVLCREIGPRPVGSTANVRAGRYVAGILRDGGLAVEEQTFECLDWQAGQLELALGDSPLEARINPFSLPCDIRAPYVVLDTLEELEASDLEGRIAVLRGTLASEPLMPKSFQFWNPERHQRIIQLLETKAPQAVLALSPRAARVEPLFEDGDFALPSATLAASMEPQLRADPGSDLTLRIASTCRPSRSANVIARRATTSNQTVVVCAHLDTKHDSPGAIDNGSGVAALLALAEVSANVSAGAGLELVFFNGEDYYSTPGQIAYLDRYGAGFDRMSAAINLDGVGAAGRNTSLALFDLPDPAASGLRRIAERFSSFEEIAPWPQGDHSLFCSHGVPSIALSSTDVEALLDTVIHTPQDRLEQLNTEAIARVVRFVCEAVRFAASSPSGWR